MIDPCGEAWYRAVLMNMEIHRQVHSLLLEARKPVLVCDRRTDGDSLGSALAVADYLATLGKRVPVFVSEPVPLAYEALALRHECVTDPSMFAKREVDLVLVFDCSEVAYVEELLAYAPRRPTVVNIDHHVTNPLYGDVKLVDTNSAATACLVHEWFVANNIRPSAHGATCLLAGVCFDTGMFSNGATNARAFAAASELLLHGAHAPSVIAMLFRNKSVDALRVWGAALSRIREMPEHGAVATCIVCADIHGSDVTQDDVGGLSNFLSLVLETDTVYVLHEMEQGGIKVSMRSRTHDVGRLAQLFGGGGHAKAAGFTMPNARIAFGAEGSWCVEKSAQT